MTSIKALTSVFLVGLMATAYPSSDAQAKCKKGDFVCEAKEEAEKKAQAAREAAKRAAEAAARSKAAEEARKAAEAAARSKAAEEARKAAEAAAKTKSVQATLSAANMQTKLRFIKELTETGMSNSTCIAFVKMAKPLDSSFIPNPAELAQQSILKAALLDIKSRLPSYSKDKANQAIKIGNKTYETGKHRVDDAANQAVRLAAQKIRSTYLGRDNDYEKVATKYFAAFVKNKAAVKKLLTPQNICGGKTADWFREQLINLGVWPDLRPFMNEKYFSKGKSNDSLGDMNEPRKFTGITFGIDIAAVAGVSFGFNIVDQIGGQEWNDGVQKTQTVTYVSWGYGGGIAAGADVGFGLNFYGMLPRKNFQGMSPGAKATYASFPGWGTTVELGVEVPAAALNLIVTSPRSYGSPLENPMGIGFSVGGGASYGAFLYIVDNTYRISKGKEQKRDWNCIAAAYASGGISQAYTGKCIK